MSDNLLICKVFNNHNFSATSTSLQLLINHNYISIDPKQQQRMFPPRSCAIQNSWNCLAHSCLLFYSFITSTVQIRGNKRTKKGEEGRQAPEPQPEAGGTRTRKSMMEQNPFPEERKKGEEGRQAPEPKKRE